MSRSRKKKPYVGYSGAESEKKVKKEWHARFRAWLRHICLHDDDFVPVDKDKHIVIDTWSLPKDGKRRLTKDDLKDKHLRK